MEASPARTRRISSQVAKGVILAEASVPSANVSLIEVAPATKMETISTEVCEIAVAGVVLRIGSSVPTKRVVELVRAARLA